MRCESGNDSNENDSEENVHEYRLISLGCLTKSGLKYSTRVWGR